MPSNCEDWEADTCTHMRILRDDRMTCDVRVADSFSFFSVYFGTQYQHLDRQVKPTSGMRARPRTCGASMGGSSRDSRDIYWRSDSLKRGWRQPSFFKRRRTLDEQGTPQLAPSPSSPLRAASRATIVPQSIVEWIE